MTVTVLILLVIATFGLLLFDSLAFILSIASGLLFVYYLAVYIGIKFAGETPNQVFAGCLYLLFSIPIVLLLLEPDHFLNFLMQGVHLDMRH